MRHYSTEDPSGSLSQESDLPELSAAQHAELDRRLTEYDRNPSAGSPWETVRAKLMKGRKPGG